jgi:hypothetical protein
MQMIVVLFFLACVEAPFAKWNEKLTQEDVDRLLIFTKLFIIRFFNHVDCKIVPFFQGYVKQFSKTENKARPAMAERALFLLREQQITDRNPS